MAQNAGDRHVVKMAELERVFESVICAGGIDPLACKTSTPNPDPRLEPSIGYSFGVEGRKHCCVSVYQYSDGTVFFAAQIVIGRASRSSEANVVLLKMNMNIATPVKLALLEDDYVSLVFRSDAANMSLRGISDVFQSMFELATHVSNELRALGIELVIGEEVAA